MNNHLEKICNQLLNKFHEKNSDRIIICMCITGSRLFATDTPHSDLDIKGIYLPSLEDIQSNKLDTLVNLDPSPNHSKNTKDDIDAEFISTQKFFQLLKNGDFNSIELLHSPKESFFIRHPIFKELQDNFNLMTPFFIRSFLGFIKKEYRAHTINQVYLKNLLAFLSELKKLDPKSKMKTHEELLNSSHYIELTKASINNRDSWIPTFKIARREFHLTSTVATIIKVLERIIANYGERRKKTIDSGIDYKGLYHVQRLLFEAKELVEQGKLTIPYPIERIEYLKKIRNGDIDLKSFKISLDEQIEYLLEIEEKTKDEKVKFNERIDKYTYNFHNSLHINYLKLINIEKKSYLVGGAVRDQLLGLPSRDLDYVVLNATESELIKNKFIKVGKAFHAFLHPISKREYVLLRGKDKKSLKGDLHARDLTINSMALNSKGELIDPFGGKKDLDNKILRHTSFHFGDDPLRVYRVARFYSIYKDFSISDKTLELMKNVASTRCFQLIPGERILKELEKAFVSIKPSLFFEALKTSLCLEASFPSLYNLIDVPQRADYHPEGCCYTHTMMVLDAARSLSENADVLLSALIHDLGKAITPQDILPKHIGHEKRGIELVENFCKKYKLSAYASKLARFTCKNHLKCHTIFMMKPTKIFRLLKEGEFKRRPQLLKDFITVCRADSFGKLKEGEYIQGTFLLECQQELAKVKIQEIIDGPINEQRVERAYSKIIAGIKNKYLIEV